MKIECRMPVGHASATPDNRSDAHAMDLTEAIAAAAGRFPEAAAAYSSLRASTASGISFVRQGEADAVVDDARAVEAAGAFSVVLEKVPVGLSARITQILSIPTIGIGAGVDCDGQVLVVDDMLGLFTEFRPKFVKRYAELGQAADQAIAAYAAEVRARAFPADEHGFADVLPTKDKP